MDDATIKALCEEVARDEQHYPPIVTRLRDALLASDTRAKAAEDLLLGVCEKVLGCTGNDAKFTFKEAYDATEAARAALGGERGTHGQ